jgi:succinate dehydrogenase / fumarate reductase cytochrome b subunit
MSEAIRDKDNGRPKHLNLLQIRLLVTGFVSIAHRLAGVLIFLATPALLYVLERSLRDPAGFSAVRTLLDDALVRLALIVVMIAVLHHLLAGIRFLLIDLGIGESIPGARRGAWLVLAGVGLSSAAALVLLL